MDRVHGRGAHATAKGEASGGAKRPAQARETFAQGAPAHLAPAYLVLTRVRAACRLCGLPVRGFLCGTTCVLQIDGRARQACRRDEARACPGLQEAVRAARRSRG